MNLATDRTASRAPSLFEQWQLHGDYRAREALVTQFMPIARKLAARYRGAAGEPFEDLLQVASLGLVKAIDRFDSTRGTAFTSFAVPTILGELKRYFRDSGWSAHVPRGLKERALKLQEAERLLSERCGRAPTTQQLAEYLEVSVEEVLEAMEAGAGHHATSLHAPRDGEDGNSETLIDLLGGEDEGFEAIEYRATLASAASQLPPRDQEVLRMRFERDLTQTEIARRLGVSQMQVSRILRRVLAQLRELTGEDG
jgi:RNA polymerase sigma-B factor